MSTTVKSIVKENVLITGEEQIPVGSASWYEWLTTAKKFSFRSTRGNFVAQCEKRRNKTYWYAYRRAGKLSKVYLGKVDELTPERLEQACLSLVGQGLLEHIADQPTREAGSPTESRIDTSLLPLTKVNVPVLPHQLITRPRLTRQITTPLTIIYAPSGFGKSTLLNDWKQTCGHPVAWLSLDDGDNQIARFWSSVIMALQTIHPDLTQGLSTYLSTAAPIQIAEAVSRLTNDIVQQQESYPHLGLVLDDFQHINRTEIYDTIQLWVEHIPPNMKLIILGHTNPPLSLGHLRSKGLMTELDAGNLRFTLEEGISYLRQYQEESALPYDDLAKLVKHTEGWAAGLTLTALALRKQEDQRQFVETFSGAHIYMREYFIETVFQRSSPKVQEFLLKTAILKHLSGGLCDAVTGQTGGEEMLSHLWHENLFIVRLEEQGWYRYHDLFSEMLRSQLQTRFPEEVPELHRRAALWYRAQYAPSDAIYHLFAIEAWEEAALLMEEMALRELEQYGEDSRLLRWLQELPASVVQKHKTLLLVYLRLAQVALPRQKIERFIGHIESNLSGKLAAQQSPDEQEVLVEIQRIRKAWEKGEQFELPIQAGGENDTRWELLSGLYLLRQTYNPFAELNSQLTDLLYKAQAQHNLFVILMTGGVLARRIFQNGELRNSEKIARQVLEQALAQRGKLPEPASIALTILSQIYLEQNKPTQAQKYLEQAVEVDPNPTSTNMPVQIALQRVEIQIAQGNFREALEITRSIRDLHLRRPSGLWTDQDLLAYEAFIHVRKGDIVSAEKHLSEFDKIEDHALAQLVQAEILLSKQDAETAEKLLSRLMLQNPSGVLNIPLLRVRMLQSKALFEQHKINQALHLVKDMVRMAASENFIRPFIECSGASISVLSLALQTGNLNAESQSFIRNILHLSNYSGENTRISQTELTALAASASISPREQEVLHLVSEGYSNREIASKLSVSESTVKTHIGNIYTKLNVNSRIHAISRAKELKLV